MGIDDFATKEVMKQVLLGAPYIGGNSPSSYSPRQIFNNVSDETELVLLFVTLSWQIAPCCFFLTGIIFRWVLSFLVLCASYTPSFQLVHMQLLIFKKCKEVT